METLVIVFVILAVAAVLITLAGGFDRVRHVRPARTVVDAPVTERVVERPVATERVVERPVATERVVERRVVD